MPTISEVVDQAVKEARAELRKRKNYREREEYARSLRSAPAGTFESMPPMVSIPFSPPEKSTKPKHEP